MVVSSVWNGGHCNHFVLNANANCLSTDGGRNVALDGDGYHGQQQQQRGLFGGFSGRGVSLLRARTTSPAILHYGDSKISLGQGRKILGSGSTLKTSKTFRFDF